MPIPATDTGAASGAQRRHLLAALAAAGVLVLLATVAWPRLRRHLDEEAVRGEVLRIESYLRAHDARTWFLVERDDAPGRPDLRHETLHQAWLADLERLSHLHGFAMANVVVQVSGDDAFVRFDVRGTPEHVSPPAPAAGELCFRRLPDGTWRLEAERLIEAPR